PPAQPAAPKPAADPAPRPADPTPLAENVVKDEAGVALHSELNAGTGALEREGGVLAHLGGGVGAPEEGLIILNLYLAYEDYKEGAKHSEGEGILNAVGTLQGAPGTGTALVKAAEFGTAVHDPKKLWDAIKANMASPVSIGMGITFGSFR